MVAYRNDKLSLEEAMTTMVAVPWADKQKRFEHENFEFYFWGDVLEKACERANIDLLDTKDTFNFTNETSYTSISCTIEVASREIQKLGFIENTVAHSPHVVISAFEEAGGRKWPYIVAGADGYPTGIARDYAESMSETSMSIEDLSIALTTNLVRWIRKDWDD